MQTAPCKRLSVHEVSVARSLVEFVRQELASSDPSPGAGRITRVRVRLGAMCGLTAHALKSAYRAAVIGTPLEGCELDIETVDLIVWCPHCHARREVTDVRYLRCPVCKTRTPQIVQGREMEIEAIEVADPAGDLAHPPGAA
jgi:hydrogenase nickel incorporation protein HypA/HybF